MKNPWEMTKEEFYQNQIEFQKGKHSPYQVKDEYYIIVHKDKEKSGKIHTSTAWKLNSNIGETPEKLRTSTIKRIDYIRQVLINNHS